MVEFEDYYEILGVSPNATHEELKRVYKDKCWILSPDRMAGTPESARKRAEKDLAEVNRAYDILKDPHKRQQYHAEWFQKKGSTASSAKDHASAKPKPIFEPTYIKFKDVRAGEVKRASFLIFNAGGSYSKVRIDSPESWLIITDYQSLTSSDELPLKGKIQALATDWNMTYSGYIRVKLDKEEATLPVELKTGKKFLIKDHEWHDIDYDDLRPWVKKPKNKAKLDRGGVCKGKIIMNRLNRSTGRYQIRLNDRYDKGWYYSI